MNKISVKKERNKPEGKDKCNVLYVVVLIYKNGDLVMICSQDEQSVNVFLGLCPSPVSGF